MEGDIKNVIKYWIEGEIENFIKVWLLIYVSLCYCFLASKILPKGLYSLLSFLPVIFFFLYVPLKINSIHLCGNTGFFISWLCNFKLILLAFDQGPLSDSSLSIAKFIILACLPIKIQQKSQKISEIYVKNRKGQILNYGIKTLLFALIIRVHDYSDNIHPYIIVVIYCFHIYLCLDIILAIVSGLARGLLGLELEPQFNEPYLSSSLQDFWGRRWNLIVTRILRPTVYKPILGLSANILGRNWAPLPAVMATFLVSGLMHELIFYYLCRAKPTWEITWFFLLHGVCLNIEICAKKAINGRFNLPRIIETILTVGFVMITGFWLFFPQLLRCNSDVRALAEYQVIGTFFKDVT
ncbi:hypothetical protein BC332_29430, partial [Capsicum chinense]